MSNSIVVAGQKIAIELQKKLKQNLLDLEIHEPIKLAVILVGNDSASKMYVSKKQSAAKELGIVCDVYEFSANAKPTEIIDKIKFIQTEKNINGIIVQFPLPDKIWPQTRVITSFIRPELDVDCLSHVSLGRILMGENIFVPPTVGAVLEIIKNYNIDLTGKHVCIVGRGELIGRPLAAYLLNSPVTLSVVSKNTKDLGSITRQADILITGVGKPNLITTDMVKDNAVVIDTATSYLAGKVRGDVDFTAVKNKTFLITPVPGGVGPITVMKLLENVIIATQNKKSA